jgi:hypothetical protein
VSLYPPNNLITAAWAALVWRVAVEWKARSLQIDGVFGPAGAALVRWHALPIAASFLFPRRLSGFVSQLVNLGPGEGLRLTDTAAYYARAAAFDYHAGWIGQSVAVVLAGALAIAVSRRQRDAVGAVLTLWIVGAIAMLVHPHWPASRFLHSYFALGWVAGSVGLARLLLATGAAPRFVTAMLTMTSLAVASETPLRGIAQWHESALAGVRLYSALDITDAYLDRLAGAQRTAVVSTADAAQLARWTYRDRYDRDGIEWPFGGGMEPARLHTLAREWLRTTTADAIVFIDVPPGSPDHVALGPYEGYGAIGSLIGQSPRFAETDRIVVPGRATVTLWRRRTPR